MSESTPAYSLVARVNGSYIYTPFTAGPLTVIKNPITFPVFDDKMARFGVTLSSARSPGLCQTLLFFLAHGRMLAERIAKSPKDSAWSKARDRLYELYEEWWIGYIPPLLDLCDRSEGFSINEVIVDLDSPHHAQLLLSTNAARLITAPSPLYLARNTELGFEALVGGHDTLHTNATKESIFALFAESQDAQELHARLTRMEGVHAFEIRTTEELCAMVAKEKRLVPTVDSETFIRAHLFPLDEMADATGDLAGVLGPPLREMLFGVPYTGSRLNTKEKP